MCVPFVIVLFVRGRGGGRRDEETVLTDVCLQWVESSDLEPETQEAAPARYHDAWRMVVGAK